MFLTYFYLKNGEKQLQISYEPKVIIKKKSQNVIFNNFY